MSKFKSLSEINPRLFITGNLRRLSFINKLFPAKTGGSISARYCYSVWLRHLVLVARFNGGKIPGRVAELGPGDSLGVGLAALLSGCEKYIALDVSRYWNPARNIQMLNEITELFKNHSDIPDNIEFPGIYPLLDDYSFPNDILSEEILMANLDRERIDKIIYELRKEDDNDSRMVNLRIPWNRQDVIDENSLDLVFSQAVLEHIDDLEKTYTYMRLWLKSSGLLSHKIDFRSHGLTRNWNGHWAMSDTVWKAVEGNRLYDINRQPISVHRSLLKTNGFNELYEQTQTTLSNIKQTDLAPKFRDLTEEDMGTSGVYFIACKS